MARADPRLRAGTAKGDPVARRAPAGRNTRRRAVASHRSPGRGKPPVPDTRADADAGPLAGARGGAVAPAGGARTGGSRPRRLGATIFALDQGDKELDALAHEQLAIRTGFDAVSFGAAQHLISSAVGDLDRPGGYEGAEFGVASSDGRMRPLGMPGYQRHRPGVRGLRDRVARLLDAVSGPTGS